jgi:hypothetical protein
MTNHPNRSKLTRHQKQAIKVLNPWGEKEAALRAALTPAASGALTWQQAETLVWASVSAMRQGASIDYSLPKILDDIFGRPDTAATICDCRPTAESAGSNPVQCEFESRQSHQ